MTPHALLTEDFDFIAFDQLSGELLSNGKVATEAQARAESIKPGVKIFILAAGAAGEWIWNNNLPLIEARLTLQKMGDISILN